MFTLKREDLIAAGVCQPGLDMLDDRGNGNDCEYPDGWTAEDSKRVYDKNPRFLRWLEINEFVPIIDFEANSNHPLLTVSSKQHFQSRFK